MGYKIFNKERNGKRGPKQRYSVFRAELRPQREIQFEKLCRFVAEAEGLDLEQFQPALDDKNFWMNTHKSILLHLYPCFANLVK